jgi:hypothetical protein
MINTPSRRYSPTLICEDPLYCDGSDLRLREEMASICNFSLLAFRN